MTLLPALLLLLIPFPIESNEESTCVCGVEGIRPRIINGQKSVIGRYPWIVFIRLAGGWYSCTGTLISDRYVMTAAHCLPHPMTPDGIVVDLDQRCGRTALWSKIYNPVKVVRIIRHEKWNGNYANGNDIALLQLEKSAFGTTRNVMPICLSRETSFENFIVAGWGYVNDGYNKVVNGCLNEAELDVIDQRTCSRYGDAYKNTKEIICAGGEKNICKGDSGGPLMSRVNGLFLQAGITSFGRNDCGIATKTPAGFTKVSSHIDWIKNQVKDGLCFV